MATFVPEGTFQPETYPSNVTASQNPSPNMPQSIPHALDYEYSTTPGLSNPVPNQATQYTYNTEAPYTKPTFTNSSFSSSFPKLEPKTESVYNDGYQMGFDLFNSNASEATDQRYSSSYEFYATGGSDMSCRQQSMTRDAGGYYYPGEGFATAWPNTSL